MRRTTSIFALIAFALALSCGISFCQEVDLSGTWEGTTEVPDMGEDGLTLVLKKKDGEYSGTISDSLGMIEDVEIEDVEFEDNTLTFNFMVFTGEDYMRVYITLTVEGDTMSGHWETEDARSAPIELKKIT